MPSRKTPAALIALMACLVTALNAQDTAFVGIHQAENEYYSRIFDTLTSTAVISPETPVALKSRTNGDPSFMVYGWHPYWAGAAAYPKYDYNVLTHIAYFSYEVDTATGGYSTLRGWDTT